MKVELGQHMKNLSFTKFFLIAVFGGVLTLFGAALGLSRIAHAEAKQFAELQAAQQHQIAQAVTLPPQLSVNCHLQRDAVFAQGRCATSYTLAARSIVIIIASFDSDSPLVPVPLTTLGNPMTTVETGNPYVTGTVTWSDIWITTPESIYTIVTLTNLSEVEQVGTASVRALMVLPQTTTPAATTAGVK